MKANQRISPVDGKVEDVNLRFKMGDRIKRVDHNIEACLNTPSSRVDKLRADQNLTWAHGVIKSVNYTGDYHWGGACVVADILWDNGEQMSVVVSMLELEMSKKSNRLILKG